MILTLSLLDIVNARLFVTWDIFYISGGNLMVLLSTGVIQINQGKESQRLMKCKAICFQPHHIQSWGKFKDFSRTYTEIQDLFEDSPQKFKDFLRLYEPWTKLN